LATIFQESDFTAQDQSPGLVLVGIKTTARFGQCLAAKPDPLRNATQPIFAGQLAAHNPNTVTSTWRFPGG
jgi:hypothetical protein